MKPGDAWQSAPLQLVNDNEVSLEYLGRKVNALLAENEAGRQPLPPPCRLLFSTNFENTEKAAGLDGDASLTLAGIGKALRQKGTESQLKEYQAKLALSMSVLGLQEGDQIFVVPKSERRKVVNLGGAFRILEHRSNTTPC